MQETGLLVEDEPLVALYGEEVLKTARGKITLGVAHDLRGAVAFLEQQGRPHWVVMDSNFRGAASDLSGGIELLHHLERHFPDVPVISISGAAKIDIVAALQSQSVAKMPDFFFRKPADFAAIAKLIGERIMPRHPGVSPEPASPSSPTP